MVGSTVAQVGILCFSMRCLLEMFYADKCYISFFSEMPECSYQGYSLVGLVWPNTEELISLPLVGL